MLLKNAENYLSDFIINAHMSMCHWWKDTNRRKPKYVVRNLTECHFIHRK